MYYQAIGLNLHLVCFHSKICEFIFTVNHHLCQIRANLILFLKDLCMVGLILLHLLFKISELSLGLLTDAIKRLIKVL